MSEHLTKSLDDFADAILDDGVIDSDEVAKIN
jgi:hypothetical protein